MNNRRSKLSAFATCLLMTATGIVTGGEGNLFGTPVARATTVRVPTDYSTIQAAINAASGGDTVLVATGIYSGAGNKDLDFGGTNLVLMSEGGTDSTIIDCGGSGRGFVFDSSEDTTSVVDGFTVTNGGTNALAGGGIRIITSSPVIKNCNIIGNTTSNAGGGITIQDNSHPRLINCTIQGNSATGDGGGIHVWNNSNPVIKNCLIDDNDTDQRGGGLWITVSSDPVVDSCVVSGNIATQDAGGMGVAGSSDPPIANCTFSGNHAVQGAGGGVYVLGSGTEPVFIGCTITDNLGGMGGGIHVESDATFTDCTVSGNQSKTWGGGVFVSQLSYPAFTSCRITGNKAIDGGGLHAREYGHPILTGCTIAGNLATGQGGGIDASHTTGSEYVHVSLTRCIVWDNCATTTGDEAYVASGDSVSFDCSAIDTSGATGPGTYANSQIVTTNPVFCGGVSCATAPTTLGNYSLAANSPCLPGNSPCAQLIGALGGGCSAKYLVPSIYSTIQAAIDAAGSGDTVFVASGTYTGAGNKDLDFGGDNIVLMSEEGPDSTVIDCEGSGRGLLFTNAEDSTAVVDGFTITNGNQTSGGGIRIDSSSPTIRNCNIVSNTSGLDGGGVFIRTSAFPKFIDCVIEGNSSGDDGGGFYIDSSSNPTIRRCAIDYNYAATQGGGLWIQVNCDPVIDSCSVSGNKAATIAGGIGMVSNCNPTITNCTVSADTAVASLGGGIAITSSSSPTVAGCTFSDNVAANSGGGVAVWSGSEPVFSNCTVTGNAAPYGAGIRVNSDAEFTGCTVSGNSAGQAGGGVWVSELSSPTFTDCAITGNTAVEGGGLHARTNAHPVLTGCTIAGNRATDQGGGINASHETALQYVRVSLTQSVVWDNCAATAGDEIYTDAGDTVTFDCSSVDTSGVDGPGHSAATQLVANPVFCAPAPCVSAPTTLGDYYLAANSPCRADSSPCGQLIGALPEGCDAKYLVPSVYATIQAAIDAAGSGDTVFVASGTYTGVGNRDLDFGGDNIVLMSEEGADSTTINAQGMGRGLVFQSGEDTTAVVDGFTILFGSGSPGGGAYITGGSTPTIRNCNFNSCVADTGGGGFLTGGRFFNCDFDANTSTTQGGGLFVINSSSPVVINNCNFNNNTGNTGGGLFFFGSALVSVSGGTFSGNFASFQGGGIAAWGGMGSITSVTVDGDSAAAGGGALVVTGADVGITNCTLENNGSAADGGAVYLWSSADAAFTGCSIMGNNAADNGGGVYGHSTGFIASFVDCDLLGNVAGGAGGAMYALSGTSDFDNCTIQGNVADSQGGALYFEDDAPFTITGCVISGNEATIANVPGIGGGLYLKFTSFTSNTFEIFSSTIAANSAETGGGVYLDAAGGAGSLHLDRSIVWGNCATTADQFWITANDTAIFDCSDIDAAGVVGSAFYGNSIFDDPLLCAPEPCIAAPTIGGAYTLDDDSPCLASNSPCMLLIGAKPQGCTGRSLDVVDDGYPTIQAAIDAAVDAVGDTVLVADSTWTGTGNTALDFDGKSVVLKSKNGPAAAIIDGQGSVRGVLFTSGEDTTSIVDGFTIKRGNPALPGSAVLVDSASSPIFRNCVIRETSGSLGIIRVESGNPRFEFCTIEEDTSTSPAGVLSLLGGSPRVVSSVIQNNRAGRAVLVQTSTYFENTTVADNDTAGVAFISAPASTYMGGSISRNGGRAVILFESSVLMDGVDISANAGGGITVTGLTGQNPIVTGPRLAAATTADSHVFERCDFTGNSADYGAGYSFDCADEPVLDYLPVFTDCRFSGNHATFFGGGLRICGSAATAMIAPSFVECTIAANTAQRGGGIYMDVDVPSPGSAIATFVQTILWGNCSTDDPEGEAFVGPGNIFDIDCSHTEYDELYIDTATPVGPGVVDTSQVTTGLPDFCDYPMSYYETACDADTTILGDFALAPSSPATVDNHPCHVQIGVAATGTCEVATAIVDEPSIARSETTLGLAAPNPFNPVTRIEFSLSRHAHVTLRIYDVTGRLVRTLADQPMPAATYDFAWDGKDNHGNPTASGVYFLNFIAGDVVRTQKLVLLK